MATTSRTPFCSKALSPFARIHLSDMNSKTFDAAQQSTSSTNKTKLSGQTSQPEPSLSRNRGLSEVGSRSKPTSLGRRITFGSSPQRKISNGSVFGNGKNRRDIGPRGEKGVDIISSDIRDIRQIEGNLKTTQPKITTDSEERAINDNQKTQSARHPRPRLDSRGLRSSSQAVNQGHTADLCWHMRLQQADGILTPPEFSSCTLHPALVDRPETPKDLRLSALTSDSLSSSRSSGRHASMSSRGSTAGSSTWAESDVSSLSSETFHTPFDASQRCTTKSGLDGEDPFLEIGKFGQWSSSKTDSGDEDPFLYIGKYDYDHAKNTRASASEAKRGEVKSSISPHCTCAKHSCHTYLSGKSTKHCRECRLPKPQPEVLAAISHLQQAQLAMAADPNGEAEIRQEFEAFDNLQEDLMLVEMYNTEMEKRCEEGVWWEGWRVVDELRRQGVRGSRYLVGKGDKGIA